MGELYGLASRMSNKKITACNLFVNRYKEGMKKTPADPFRHAKLQPLGLRLPPSLLESLALEAKRTTSTPSSLARAILHEYFALRGAK